MQISLNFHQQYFRKFDFLEQSGAALCLNGAQAAQSIKKTEYFSVRAKILLQKSYVW